MSFGGGIQSTAIFALQITGKLPNNYDQYIFCNVGADSENPATLTYINEVIKPLANQHNVQFEEIHKMRRGEIDTVYKACMRDDKSVPIPVILNSGAPGLRSCTTDFKVALLDKHLKRATFTHATIGLGISLDEYRRARFDADYVKVPRVSQFYKKREYPLIDMRITRVMCKQIIQNAGLPIPPKSACFFCPFQSAAQWVNLRRDNPELFAKAVQLDEMVRTKRLINKNSDACFLHPARVPLSQAVGEQPLLIPYDDTTDTCESGYCMT